MKLTKILPALLFALLAAMSSCKKDEGPGVGATETTIILLNNATGITLNSTVSATFSAEMDSFSITTNSFTVKDGSNTIPGSTVYSGTTATVTPIKFFQAGKVCTVTVTTGAKDISGKGLSASKARSFTTGGTLTYLAEVNLRVAAAITGDLGLSPTAQSFITGFSQINATGFACTSDR